MNVTKRDGTTEKVSFDKITERIDNLTEGLDPLVDSAKVAKKVIDGMYDFVSTHELDILAAETAAMMTTIHPDYTKLASRIAVSNLHKNTKNSFFKKMEDLFNYVDPKNNQKAPLIADETMTIVLDHWEVLEEKIDYNRDFDYDYFGFKTLEKSYLFKLNGSIAERPQDMLMRVSIGIHGDDIEEILSTYEMMSKRLFTHATPTLFNSGTPKPQMSSCFLLAMQDDSIEGIYDTLKQTALISQSAGGVGLSIHNIRGTGSYIRGTNGTSNGIVPMLRVFNDTARYVDQCFDPNTMVYTIDGVKQIGDVSINEKLLTANGEYNKVSRLLRKEYVGEMISLSIKQSIEPVKVTPSHPFLVLRDQQKGINFNTIKNRLDKKIIEPEWIEAKDLTKNDLIAFPISNYEEDIDIFSEEDCYFYGLMVGDGYISKGGKQANITTNLKSVEVIEFVEKYLNERGIKFSIDKREETGCIRHVWSAHLGFKFGRSMLYDVVGDKIIHSSLLHLPKNKSLQVIRGLLMSDGHIGKKEILLEMTSRNVIESARFILMRFGILTSGNKRNRVGNVSSYKKIITKKESFTLRIPKVESIAKMLSIESGSFQTYLKHGNYAFSRIDNVSKKEYSGIVVDFEVEPNHNYVTHAGIAHNGGGKRKGSFAIYIEPWHSDIFDFLDLRKNTGKEEMRARDLFLGMWIPDLFMERVETDSNWSLMCPNECPNLDEVYGDAFKTLYEGYESAGKIKKTIRARELWEKILESQIETGTPYMLYKDAANEKSNQKNLGTIKCSNLCTEIIEYTSPTEVAVCNLASISLPMFVKDGKFDHSLLYAVTRKITRNLNSVIDRNYYPVEEAKNSNMKHRPIGLGVQGLADAFMLLRLPFTSPEAKQLNKDIFETIYFAALRESSALAYEFGSYESYEGSPISQGIFQHNLWGIDNQSLSGNWNWEDLKREIEMSGVRNSLLLAPMPTASTSQILGNNEAFEPYTSNIYTRRTLSGEFIMINRHLILDLIKIGLWNDEMKQILMKSNGSIQNINGIPQSLKNLYKTVWEMSMKDIIDMSRDRGYFVDQSQSLNLFMENANYAKLSSMHLYAWKQGLKTGMYYLRTKAAVDAIKFTLNNDKKPVETDQMELEDFKSMLERSKNADPDDCEMCGS